MADEPLRLLIYDDSCRGKHRLLPGLTHSWIAGRLLYTSLGRIDRAFAARDWQKALQWLIDVEPHRPISEIQYWGHGKWGKLFIDGQPLDVSALDPKHPYFPLLTQIRARLTGPQALWWFRTCETFGAEAGHRFAQAWTSFFGCRAAGHTYIIGPWQSGLHCLHPGQKPHWSTHEGLEKGSPATPLKARWSKAGEPNTIFCVQNWHRELQG